MYLFNSYEELTARLEKVKTFMEAVAIMRSLEARHAPADWIRAAANKAYMLMWEIGA